MWQAEKTRFLERRDSIQLQQALQGANTVFGVHSDSPRWKKVAAINRKRAKKKSERSQPKHTSPDNVGLVFDSGEEDEKEEGKWGGELGERGEEEKGGEEEKEHQGSSNLRGRMDSLQLQREMHGNNTIEVLVDKNALREAVAPASPYSPRLDKIRQLNKERKEKKPTKPRKNSGNVLFD